MKKKVLSFGYGFERMLKAYHVGDLSRRTFYGLLDLKEKYDVKVVSFESMGGLKSLFRNNMKMLEKSDIIYLLYLYVSPLILVSFLKSIGLCRKKKIVVISHENLHLGSDMKERWLHKLVFRNIDVILFHSQLNLEESVAQGLVRPERARFFYWGDDLVYVDRTYKVSAGNFFISTGREYRDFDILLSAFAQTNSELELYTNRINYDNNYESLDAEQGKYDNIKIEFVENTKETSRMLAQRTAECLCVVIPLKSQHVTYCIGLTSVVEAMAMGKPIISSPNPYSPVDIEKEKIGIVARSHDEWVAAINYLQSHPEEARAMGQRARSLAVSCYNIDSTARLLDDVFAAL